MQVVIDEDQRPEASLSALFQKAAALAVRRERIDPDACEVSLSFADPEEIRTLNAQYRDKDQPTDVLSFPMYENADKIRAAASPVLLGDIVICREIANRQAEEYGHSVERELVYLFVHSMFHLLGYDHEDSGANRADGHMGVVAGDKIAMRAAEETVLRALQIDRV